MKNIIKRILNCIEEINKKHIDQYTSQCAYFTILSFIPVMMLILTLTKYVGIEQDTLFFILNQLLPSNFLNDAVLGIVKEVYSKSIGTITISAIFILWSAGKGFLALCKGLDAVYEVPENKKFMYFRVKATICTILFIVFIIGTLLLIVFGNSINGILQERFHVVSDLFNNILRLRHVVLILLLTIVFTIAYQFIPKHGYKIRNQILGAVLAAIACDVISMFYSVYVDVFTGFSVMYGSLTTIVLAMMWIYACMYCILLGAMINKKLAEKNVENRRKIYKKSY